MAFVPPVINPIKAHSQRKTIVRHPHDRSGTATSKGVRQMSPFFRDSVC
jgi:hypothetical protein